MTLPGKGFWVGLATGLVVAGGISVFAMNHQARIKHTFATTSDTTTAIYLNSLRAKFEAGETERAKQYHRFIAWALSEQRRYNDCVAKSPWALGGSELHGCTLSFSQEIPENWEIPGLEHAREVLARQRAMRSRQSDAES